jgi:hypothetical protein
LAACRTKEDASNNEAWGIFVSRHSKEVSDMDFNYALTVLGVVSITALGVFLRLRWGKGGPDLETGPKQGASQRKK